MKNILLILDNALEFDLARTILFKLGFNVLSLKKGDDIRSRLKENFPELVITSIVGSQDEMLQEFIKIRDKMGVPKFIWVGQVSKVKDFSEVQKKVIDSTLARPLQPEQLIGAVCGLLDLPSEQHIAKYRFLVAGKGSQQPVSKIIDPVRAAAYAEKIKKIESKDKVFSLKELSSRNDLKAGIENTPELGIQKKEFIKKLLKTKASKI